MWPPIIIGVIIWGILWNFFKLFDLKALSFATWVKSLSLGFGHIQPCIDMCSLSLGQHSATFNVTSIYHQFIGLGSLKPKK
jgi:hypothetical protein